MATARSSLPRSATTPTRSTATAATTTAACPVRRCGSRPTPAPGSCATAATPSPSRSRAASPWPGTSRPKPRGWNLWVRQYSADGEPEWTWALPGPGDDEAWSIISVDGDEWLVAGDLSTENEEDHNGWIGRLDADGILLWQVEYDGGSGYLDVVRDIALADNGDIMAVGYATNDRGLETDLWYQRRSGDGQQILWDQIIPGLQVNATDRLHGITPLADGWLAVGRMQTWEPAWLLAWLRRFDQSGAPVWEELQDQGTNTVWTAAEQLPNGNAVIAGWRGSGPGETDSDMWLQERTPDGSVAWEEVIASPGGDDDKANVLAVDDRGGFIVGGEMGAGAGSTDAWIRRYAPDRTEVWTMNVSGLAGDRDTTWGLALAPDGALYACGYSATPGSEWDLWVRRFTP